MTVALTPYLGFRDNAREAMEFYHSVFGGELTSSTFEEYHASDDPAEKDKLMHSQLIAGNLTLMAADTPNSMSYTPGDNFSVSLFGAASDDAELRGYWAKLNDGGTQVQPLEVAPWGDAFGMVKDKFGVLWLVNISGT